MHRVSLLMICLASGCSLVTVEQSSFPPLEVQAEAPAPRVVLTKSSIKIKEKVQFALDSADLLPASHSLLDEVAQVLRDNPQIKLVRVEGHTDTTGNRDYNMRLSKMRAASVRAYLVNQGIAPERMIPEGYGPTKPIASNSNEKGRERNRRVEFNILEQGPKKTIVRDK